MQAPREPPAPSSYLRTHHLTTDVISPLVSCMVFFFFFLIDLTFKIAWSQLIFKVHGRSLLLYVTNFINYVFLVF